MIHLFFIIQLYNLLSRTASTNKTIVLLAGIRNSTMGLLIGMNSQPVSTLPLDYASQTVRIPERWSPTNNFSMYGNIIDIKMVSYFALYSDVIMLYL